MILTYRFLLAETSNKDFPIKARSYMEKMIENIVGEEREEKNFHDYMRESLLFERAEMNKIHKAYAICSKYIHDYMCDPKLTFNQQNTIKVALTYIEHKKMLLSVEVQHA